MEKEDLVLIEGRKDDPFARSLAEYLGVRLCEVAFTEFRNDAGPMSGEKKVEIRENIRGRHVYVAWTVEQTNYELMVVLQIIDAARLSSEAHRISLVCPEFPCARQDKTHDRRESLSSRLVARLLEAAGLDDVLTADLHSDQIEGHFRIPLDHLRTRPIWAHYIARRYREWMETSGLGPEGADLVLGVPDAGRARAVRELSDEVARNLRLTEQKIRLRLAHHDKHRRWEVPGQISTHGLLGNVAGRVVWFTDDILASGGTLLEAATAAKDAGARHVVCSVTHAHGHDVPPEDGKPARIFVDQLLGSAIDELVVTDTHPLVLQRVKDDPRLASRVTVLSLTPLFGEALRRVRGGQTLKEMIRQVPDHGALYRVVHEATARPTPPRA
jgi:ribose-phosphate pyrophosphokinase